MDRQVFPPEVPCETDEIDTLLEAGDVDVGKHFSGAQWIRMIGVLRSIITRALYRYRDTHNAFMRRWILQLKKGLLKVSWSKSYGISVYGHTFAESQCGRTGCKKGNDSMYRK